MKDFIKNITFLLVKVPMYFMLGIVMQIIAKIPYFANIAATRRTNGNLETPAITLFNESTGRTIQLYGMMHVADDCLYSEVYKRIKAVQTTGSIVFYEGVWGKVDREQLTKKEQACYDQMEKLFESYPLVAKLLNLPTQDQMKHEQSWINGDISRIESIRLLAENNTGLAFDPDSFNILTKLSKNESLTKIAEILIGFIMSREPEMSLYNDFKERFNKVERNKSKIILDYRNEVLCQKMKEYFSNDLVAFWGSKHLAGICNILKYEGFHEIRREWIPCYHIRELSFSEIFSTIKSIKLAELNEGME